MVLLAFLPGACDSGGNGHKKKKSSADIGAAPYTETFVLDPITQTVSDVDFAKADVPETSSAMGIATIGLLEDYKLIVHGFTVTVGGSELFITGPSGEKAPRSYKGSYAQRAMSTSPGGEKAPLSYSLDLNGDPEPVTANIQASAVLFPNNGESASLDAGTWRIPIATVNVAGTAFEPDTMTTLVYYKTETTIRPALKLNVWVLKGVNPLITGDATALADAEIQGALRVLNNVYEANASTNINIEPSVRYIATAGLDRITTDAAMYSLVSSYPSPVENDRMNIFVVTALDNLPLGVIGLALGLPGPFNHQGTAVSGTLAEYQSDGNGITLGYILAHEFGHYLGLFHSSQTNSPGTAIVGHDPISDTPDCVSADLGSPANIDNCPDRHNLMFPYVCDPTVETGCDNPDVSQGQGNVVRYNPGVTP
jgi:hypothetical protein